MFVFAILVLFFACSTIGVNIFAIKLLSKEEKFSSQMIPSLFTIFCIVLAFFLEMVNGRGLFEPEYTMKDASYETICLFLSICLYIGILFSLLVILSKKFRLFLFSIKEFTKYMVITGLVLIMVFVLMMYFLPDYYYQHKGYSEISGF